MKTNNTKKKSSASKKLLPAAGSLMISAAMLATSTYAWFTMNKEVEVTGMQMKTKVSGNLLISSNNMEADYTTETLTQARKALLEPVSSINGSDGSFWFTVHAKGNGDAVDDESYTAYSENVALGEGAIDLISNYNSTTAGTYPTTNGAGKTHVASAFNSGAGSYQNSNYAVDAGTAYDNAYGYVDYVFYLKATGDGTDTLIRLTELNLLRNTATATVPSGAIDNSSGTVGEDLDRAWRAAVFCSDISSNGGKGLVSAVQTSNATSGNLQAILTLEDAANHSDTGGHNYAINANDEPVQMTMDYNTWSGSDEEIATVANGTTGYYKVTIRLWLEGEDTTCNSRTYARLTNEYSLDATFDLTNASTGEDAVANIGSSVS